MRPRPDTRTAPGAMWEADAHALEQLLAHALGVLRERDAQARAMREQRIDAWMWAVAA